MSERGRSAYVLSSGMEQGSPRASQIPPEPRAECSFLVAFLSCTKPGVMLEEPKTESIVQTLWLPPGKGEWRHFSHPGTCLGHLLQVSGIRG